MGKEHPLERNTIEEEYFGRLNRNGKAAYRHAVRSLTGSLPAWAGDKRGNVATKQTGNVATMQATNVATTYAANVATTPDDNVATLSEEPPLTLAEKLAKLTRMKQTDNHDAPAVDPLTLL